MACGRLATEAAGPRTLCGGGQLIAIARINFSDAATRSYHKSAIYFVRLAGGFGITPSLISSFVVSRARLMMAEAMSRCFSLLNLI